MSQINGFRDFNPNKDLPSLDQKVILITGGTAGIGRESVIALARHNPAHIYFTGRNAKAGADLVAALHKDHPAVGTTFLELDMASLATVKNAIQQRFTSDRLDIILCNAGIMATPAALSTDGFEMQFAVNHLAHALLIRELLPVLQRTAALPNADVRVVALTSEGFALHPRGGVLFDRLRTTMDSFSVGGWTRYGQSKLANIIYAAQLARRYPEILAVSVHPGVVRTGLIEQLGLVNKVITYGANALMGRTLMTPEQGAYNQVWMAAGMPREKVKTGAYYKPVGVLSKTDKTAEDEKLGDKLWDWTQEALAPF